MANFMEQIWGSIFTPGPTPPLLLATNLTFGCLQILLLALLAATRSIHFAVLSFLCAGLWWGINWFAAEIMLVAEEQRVKEEREAREKEGAEGLESGADDEGSGTSTADEGVGDVDAAAGAETRVTVGGEAQSDAGSVEGSFNTGAATRLAPTSAGSSEVRQRRSLAESTVDLSTDSEWEKVEDVR